MCGRYVRRSDKQEIKERFRLGKLPEGFVLPPDFNVAPNTSQPVIRNAKDHGERELTQMRWGLLPFFAAGPSDFKGISTINARAESVAKSPSFREPCKRRRCLVPADAFYEWEGAERFEASEEAALRFQHAHRRTFRLRRSVGRVGRAEEVVAAQAHDEWLQSFTIITTDANELMSTVYTRMPVILPESAWTMWLDRDFGSAPGDIPQLQSLLRPFDSDAMTTAPANQAVGNVKNNGPRCWTPPPSSFPHQVQRGSKQQIMRV